MGSEDELDLFLKLGSENDSSSEEATDCADADRGKTIQYSSRFRLCLFPRSVNTRFHTLGLFACIVFGGREKTIANRVVRLDLWSLV